MFKMTAGGKLLYTTESPAWRSVTTLEGGMGEGRGGSKREGYIKNYG